jgi:CheY-like chemotaxis protein
LAFGRRQRLDRRIININDTITDFTQMLRRIIGEDIEVRLETGVNLPHVFADPAQIEQAVMNLAVNSRDAMPMGGCISIQTTAVTLDAAFCREHAWAKPGRYVEVAVADTGQGMDPETQQRIFEPFFTTKEMGKGTGLGLAVVYGIVKQHEGAVAVESKPGQGTTFRMFLPIVETAEYAEARELAAPLRGGAETILVAEDEEALRKLVGDVLGKLGYHVLLARNGEEAIHLYKSNHKTIKLAILDLVMPKMGGRETAERIRKGGNNIPVIFVTGYSAEAARGQFGVNGTTLIQKPYSIDELGRRVREMLDERKQPITAGSSV